MKVFILYVFELPWKWNSARFQISRWLLSQSIEHVSALIQKNIRQSFLCAVAFCSPGIVVVGLCQWLFRLRIWLHVLPEQAQVNAPSFYSGTTQQVSGDPAEMIAGAVVGRMATCSPEVVEGPEGFYPHPGELFADGESWGERRDHFFFKFVNHCPASRRWESTSESS